MTFFIVFVSVVIIQRTLELFIAQRNASKLFSMGAIEYDNNGYKFIVLIHVLFFVSLISEFIFLNKALSPVFPSLLVIFLLAQFLRYWAVISLGIFWNTKIIVLKGKKLINTGPYRFFRHPNYIAVAAEIAVIPLIFSCFITAALFSILNLIVLKRRIKIETAALYIYQNK